LCPDYSLILKGYTGWPEHHLGAKSSKSALSGAVFSEADDCAVLVNCL